MPDEMVTVHAGEGKGMSGAGAWFLLFFTIMLAVIAAILVLDVVNNFISPSTTSSS